MAKAKPFIKWVGGKGQLLDQLDAYLPEEFGERRNITYIEPFIGETFDNYGKESYKYRSKGHNSSYN